MYKIVYHCNQLVLPRSNKKADLSDDIGMLSAAITLLPVEEAVCQNQRQKCAARFSRILPPYLLPANSYHACKAIPRRICWKHHPKQALVWQLCLWCILHHLAPLILYCKRHPFAKSLNSSHPSKETTRAISNANTSAKSSPEKFWWVPNFQYTTADSYKLSQWPQCW